MYKTARCYSLIVVKIGRVSSAPLTWFRPVDAFEERAWLAKLSLFSRELFCQTPRAFAPFAFQNSS